MAAFSQNQFRDAKDLDTRSLQAAPLRNEKRSNTRRSIVGALSKLVVRQICYMTIGFCLVPCKPGAVKYREGLTKSVNLLVGSAEAAAVLFGQHLRGKANELKENFKAL